MHPLLLALVLTTLGALLGAFFVGIKPSREEMRKRYSGNTPLARRLHGILEGAFNGAPFGIVISGIAWIAYLLVLGEKADPIVRDVTLNFGLGGALVLALLAIAFILKIEDDLPLGVMSILIFTWQVCGIGFGGAIALTILSCLSLT